MVFLSGCGKGSEIGKTVEEGKSMVTSDAEGNSKSFQTEGKNKKQGLPPLPPMSQVINIKIEVEADRYEEIVSEVENYFKANSVVLRSNSMTLDSEYVIEIDVQSDAVSEIFLILDKHGDLQIVGNDKGLYAKEYVSMRIVLIKAQ
jgi:hypothetical protein